MEKPTIEELGTFTLGSYKKLLSYLKQVFEIKRFCDFQWKENRRLLLRHDIDYSFAAALKMAQIEYELGIRSTYFVLVNYPLYNISQADQASALKQICNLGHEIGLHYYPPRYLPYGRKANKILEAEMRELEGITGTKVCTLARHGSMDRDPFAKTKYLNANHPDLRADIFIHESCRAWTPLYGLLQLLTNPPRKAQLLTHPENWCEKTVDKDSLFRWLWRNSDPQKAMQMKTVKKVWFTDPQVLEYERFMKHPEMIRAQDSNRANQRLDKTFNHFYYSSKWYFINTTFGWRVNQIMLFTNQRMFGSFRARSN